MARSIEAGEKFGMWTAIRFIRIAKVPEKKRGQIWLFQCECGVEREMFASPVTNGKSNSCKSCALRGKPSRNYKGGSINKDGYKVLHRPGHPNARSGGAIFEHTLVMSEYLCRPLTPEETVHHKNGNRLDNDISNLELWSTSQPPGQRVEDKVQWAKEILALYGEDYG